MTVSSVKPFLAQWNRNRKACGRVCMCMCCIHVLYTEKKALLNGPLIVIMTTYICSDFNKITAKMTFLGSYNMSLLK